MTLSTSQRAGELVVAVFSLLSALALALMALRLIQLVVTSLRGGCNTSQPPEILFFRTQLGHYAGCIALSNLFISVAELIEFRWVSSSALKPGPACSAHVMLMQIGLWGTCWFTIALGVHTFSILVFHIRQPRWRVWVVIGIGWTIAFVAALVPLSRKVYGPDGPFCSIVRSYPDDIFVLEVFPIILAALVSTAVYSVIFLVLRGKLSANSIQMLRGANQRTDGFEEYHTFIRSIVWTMSWFPFAFVLLLLPFCVTRVLLYAGHSVSSAWSVLTDVCVALLGFVNVGLLCNAFRVISSACYASRSARAAADTVKTFGNDASGESPIDPRPNFSSQLTIPSYVSGHQTHYPTPPPPNHSRDLSWSTVDSNTELLDADKSHAIISPQRNIKTQVQSETIPSYGPSLDSRPPRVTFMTAATQPKHSIHGQQCSFHPMAGIVTPSATHLSYHSVMSFPLPSREVPNKSGETIARHAITATPNADNDLTGKLDARPLPPLPESERDIVDPCSSPECVRSQNQRSSLSTVWSQETGYTMSPFPDTRIDAAWRPPVANAPMSAGEQGRARAGLPGSHNQVTRPTPLDLSRVPSNPKILNNWPPRIVIAVNDSV